MTDLAWVTCLDPPDVDHDEEPSLRALAAAGLNVSKLAWDDPAAAPLSSFRLCVLRSCWNYYEDPAAFTSWLERADQASCLLNGPQVARWNLHKGYLAQLAGEGVPIVPTRIAERGQAFSVRDCLVQEAWGDIVVKPAVSAGSFATRRFAAGETVAAQAFLDQHLLERDMLVQCFVPSVEDVGERCLVWIDGAFTHAVDKRPRFAEDEESVSDALPVERSERELGEQILSVAARVGGFSLSALLYARVDTVLHEGRRVLGELELLEPSLFVVQAPAALERLVQALERRLEQMRS